MTGFLTSANSSVGSVDGSFASDRSERNISGFKIMTVTRGFTEEADKLLDYLVSTFDAYMLLQTDDPGG